MAKIKQEIKKAIEQPIKITEYKPIPRFNGGCKNC